jgi:hypothetical protein
VLYADSAGLDSESINLEALETLVTVSGMAVELLSAARGTGAATPKRVEEAPSAAPAPEPAYEPAGEPAYEPASEYAEPAFEPVEPAFSGADTIQSYEPAPAAESESLVEAVPMDAPSGVFEATPVEEAAPAEDAWATPVEPEPAAATPRRRYGQDAELPVEVHGDEERRLHNDARRFARLLISEIKLYNEQKVAEGRTEHDLYDRLREYIDRSREMYDKRVKAEVAARYDYFHGELVNTLAEGDASKLGSNYPGATVNV